jgi:hypothetical protein
MLRGDSIPVVFVLVSAVSVFHKAAKPILERKQTNQEFKKAMRKQNLQFVHSISVQKFKVIFYKFFLLPTVVKKGIFKCHQQQQQRIKN